MSITRRIPILLSLALTLTACRQDPAAERLTSRDAPPAAAVVAPGEAHDLSEGLVMLDAELEAALEEGSVDRLVTAEALTDQLMEARREIDWLATGYDLEARLRQLQTMADRIVARMRRGATLGEVEEDVRMTREAVQELMTQLDREGGGDAPPRLETLLAQDPLRDVQARSARRAAEAAEEETGGQGDEGPLGQPVNP